jgi:hypothetical protein
MAERNDRIHEEVEELRRLRDELRVRLHLARVEARDRFERLEKSWQHLEARLRRIREESREDLGDIGQAARLLVDEIREGYRHLRQLL